VCDWNAKVSCFKDVTPSSEGSAFSEPNRKLESYIQYANPIPQPVAAGER
jgi:hypothetical protein